MRDKPEKLTREMAEKWVELPLPDNHTPYGHIPGKAQPGLPKGYFHIV